MAKLASRVTIVPMKEGTKEVMLDHANSKLMRDGLAAPAFAEMTSLFAIVGENGDKFVAVSQFASLGALTGSTEAQTKIMGGMKDMFAGAPEKTAGMVEWAHKGSAVAPPAGSAAPLASRVTVVPLRPGTDVAALVAYAEKKVAPGLAALEFRELVEVSVLIGEDKLISVSKYTTMDGLKGSDASQAKLMGGMMEFFAGPPERITGHIEWAWTPPATCPYYGTVYAAENLSIFSRLAKPFLGGSTLGAAVN